MDVPAKVLPTVRRQRAVQRARVDAVLRWLDEPVDTRPQFLTLYFEEPDHTGHEKGPDSADVAEARGLLDGDDAIHVIHVGDHGMAGVGGECRYVPVDEIAPNFNASWFEAAHVGYGHLGGNAPLLRVRPPTAKDADVAYTQLAGAMHVANARVRVYKESQLAGAPWNQKHICGEHGYNNSLLDMHTVFTGIGPRFARGRSFEGFDNLEVYRIVADILQWKQPADTNGTDVHKRILLPLRRDN